MVEESPSTAEMMVLVLTGIGFDVVHCANGYAAVEIAQHWSPGLVLLESRLPDLSGAEVCRLLRNPVAVPVMIVSTETDPGEIATVMAAGACGYLRKPFRCSELLNRVFTELGIGP
ncbi:response regulator transcription factor [Nocardia sp. NBC_01329]|uniref:response regulator transcription factor n=1 Tax=Nocardia sp. NBC_01329 TaxID=2903594 RepID=UPI002E112963|nr:response regulator [Nocardia sp. NBC_01329]